MGLDMYLMRRLYVGAIYEHRKIEGTISITQNGQPLEVDLKSVEYIEERAGYWRKANAIHAWFVENVQDGRDECQRSYVSRVQLRKLLDTVNKVIDSCKLIPGEVLNGYTYGPEGKVVANVEAGQVIENSAVAALLLPAQEGFFFGNTEYNEWYLDDLLETKRILEEALQDKYEDWGFEYHASW